VVFFAVPAEEGGDLEWRIAQKRAGRLEFLSGKQELIRLGALHDIDLAMMIHMSWRAEAGRASLQASNNGRVGKAAVFTGRAAHAGSAPHLGINALYAAQLALTAINAVRETFRDDDAIRVHPILTQGGAQVNVIPGQARLEMYVRGKTAEGILDASRKVDRALRAGALALGATVEIETVPGPLPLLNEPTMERLFHDAASALVGAEHVKRTGHSGGCTDMGDVSHLMPVLHPYMGGATGAGHGADYTIVDPQLAYVTPAKALASMAIDLLADGAARAGEILRSSRPRMTRDEYLAFQRGLEERRVYDEGNLPAPAR
jgi:amidohydrolase